MKTVGIVASPRRDGNTAKIVQTILEGAKVKGSETEIIYLGDLQIAPCDACDACVETGDCTLQDDMQTIYVALEEADNIVLGTPIYFDHVSAQAKALIDRLYSFEWVKRLNDGKKAVVAITYEWNRPDAYDDVLDWIQGRLKKYHGIDTVATVKAYNTIKVPVENQPDVLREACSAGEKLADAS